MIFYPIAQRQDHTEIAPLLGPSGGVVLMLSSAPMSVSVASGTWDGTIFIHSQTSKDALVILTSAGL